MGQNNPATTWTFCPRGVPPYIVHMHAAQDYAANLHGRRLNIVCGLVDGKNEGISGFATLRYRALSYTVTSIANVATPACLSLLRRKNTLGKASLRPSDERTNQKKMEKKLSTTRKKKK